MSEEYIVRKTCHTEVGDEKGFHYFRETQTIIDETITCPDHQEAETDDFVVEHIVIIP